MAPGFVAPKFEVPINGFTYSNKLAVLVLEFF
jgi:hypothetical protein